MAKAPRETAFQRFMARVHAHPQARLLEFLLWGVPGALFIAFAIVGHRAGWLNAAIALIAGIVGACLIGWGMLPPRKKKQAKPLPPKLKRKGLESRR